MPQHLRFNSTLRAFCIGSISDAILLTSPDLRLAIYVVNLKIHMPLTWPLAIIHAPLTCSL